MHERQIQFFKTACGGTAAAACCEDGAQAACLRCSCCTQLTRFEMQVIPLKSTAEYKKILSDFNARRFSSPSMQDEGH